MKQEDTKKAKIIRLATYSQGPRTAKDGSPELSRLLAYVEELEDRVKALERLTNKLVRIITSSDQ